jgi:hypothetical protein
MKLKLPSRKFIVGILSVFIALAVAWTLIPTASVSAGDEGPLTPIPGLGRPSNLVLIRMHKQLGGWYNDQDALIKKADQLAQRYDELVTASAAQQHADILQEGLGTFKAEVEAVRQIHLVAAGSIYSLTGFKSNGDVRDRLAAGIQIQDGLASLREANHRLDEAMRQLRKNFAQYLHARRPAADRPKYKYP